MSHRSCLQPKVIKGIDRLNPDTSTGSQWFRAPLTPEALNFGAPPDAADEAPALEVAVVQGFGIPDATGPAQGPPIGPKVNRKGQPQLSQRGNGGVSGDHPSWPWNSKRGMRDRQLRVFSQFEGLFGFTPTPSCIFARKHLFAKLSVAPLTTDN